MKLFKIICWFFHLFDKDLVVWYHSPRKDTIGVWQEGDLSAFYESYEINIEDTFIKGPKTDTP